MYKVIDDFTLETKLFEDKKEAIKECINIQGIIVDTTTDEVIYDATDF